MKDRNIPIINMETDYSGEDSGQIKTRVEAFLYYQYRTEVGCPYSFPLIQYLSFYWKQACARKLHYCAYTKGIVPSAGKCKQMQGKKDEETMKRLIEKIPKYWIS